MYQRSTSSLDEAKRWFEVSAVICHFVPNRESWADKVSAYFCLTLVFLFAG
jgi:hypothetical protein